MGGVYSGFELVFGTDCDHPHHCAVATNRNTHTNVILELSNLDTGHVTSVVCVCSGSLCYYSDR